MYNFFFRIEAYVYYLMQLCKTRQTICILNCFSKIEELLYNFTYFYVYIYICVFSSTNLIVKSYDITFR